MRKNFKILKTFFKNNKNFKSLSQNFISDLIFLYLPGNYDNENYSEFAKKFM